MICSELTTFAVESPTNKLLISNKIINGKYLIFNKF